MFSVFVLLSFDVEKKHRINCQISVCTGMMGFSSVALEIEYCLLATVSDKCSEVVSLFNI